MIRSHFLEGRKSPDRILMLCWMSCTHTYIRTYIHTYVRTYIHTYVHTYLRTYIRTYIHTYVRTYVRTYLRTYVRTRTYIHTYRALVLVGFGAVGTWTCPKQTSSKIYCIMKDIPSLRDIVHVRLLIFFFDHHLNLNLQRYYSWYRSRFKLFSS